jgi:hypothetical protein
MDIFPRYGSFIGFFPLYDPRLMWSNVIGPLAFTSGNTRANRAR